VGGKCKGFAQNYHDTEEGKSKKAEGKSEEARSPPHFCLPPFASYFRVCRRARVDDKVPFQLNRTPKR
jgi:hypothetical protein